ncbi:M6 family metalloprotease domain-containing protein [bacterium]|nr:M6 family metalloprotease domain-containing protein [bacterium]
MSRAALGRFFTLICAALLWLAISLPAEAVVRPPQEWFDSPEKEALWQEMWPRLNELEFGKAEPLTGTPADSQRGIESYFGASTEAVNAELGQAADSPAARSYDLNLDGRVNHFDLLELGYEAPANVRRASTAPPTGNNKIVVLRADFQDQSASYGTYNINYFNARFFSDSTEPYPSFRDYFQEVSYGLLDVTGAVPNCGPGGDGWCKADNTKQWYIDNGGNWLVKEAILDADANGFDFSQYDVDGDGYVDTVMCFYPNAVFQGGLWPHRGGGLNITVDGVKIDSYFITGYSGNGSYGGSDSWTMVISAHEYGHILGLPDLYDVNGGSAGMGYWSLMAYNYDNGQKPPSPDPWCKTQLGWVTPQVVTENLDNYSLGNYQDAPNVLKVWTNGKQESQYFLVANYRKKKTDANRPGEGLLVLHIDDSIAGGNGDNANEDRKHVDVEAANGYSAATKDTATPKDELDDGNNGSGPNLWYAGNPDSDYTGFFNDTSNPHSRNYPSPGSNTFIQLSEISAPGDSMTLDVTVKTANAPVVNITSPVDGAAVSGNTTVDVDVTAGSGRSILRVEFYCNGAILGSDSTAPYSLSFDSRPIYAGSRKIRAIAYDDAGDANASTEEIGIDEITVSVSNSGQSVPYFENFDAGVGAWAVYDPSGRERWQARTLSGVTCGGIGKSSNPNAGYDYNEHDSFVSLRLDLTGTTHPVCRFRQRYRVASGENTIRVFATDDNGASLDLLSAQTGNNLSWHYTAVDLLDYVGDQIYLVFKLDSTSLNRTSGTEAGWWIDEFEIKEISAAPQVISITPGTGSTLTGVQTITVTATDDEAVTGVDFLLNGNDLLTSDYSAPFTYDFNSDWLFNGATTFKAVAYDADFQTAEASVSWTISNAGLNVPWSENFGSSIGTVWRIKDESGAGEWYWANNFGYNPSGGYHCGTGGNYDDNESDWFISPTLNIGTLNDPGIGYLHKYDLETGWDFGRLFVTTNLNTWTQLNQFTGQGTPTWQAAGARLDAYNNQKIKLAWQMTSDVAVVRTGWWMDEAQLVTAPQISSLSHTRIVRGQQLTITGTGFGTNAANDFSSVTFSGSAGSINSWNDTSIVVTVPTGAPSNSTVVVNRHGIPSDGVALKVVLGAPSLTGVGQL